MLLSVLIAPSLHLGEENKVGATEVRGLATKNSGGLNPHLANGPLPASSATPALSALVSRKSWKGEALDCKVYMNRDQASSHNIHKLIFTSAPVPRPRGLC